MITTASAAAMGAIEGENFATRQVMAVQAAATLATCDTRDLMIGATSAAWQGKQQDELRQRRLELAERGADLIVMTAYEEAWWTAFSATMRAATAAIEQAQPSAPVTPRRRVKAVDRRGLQ